MQVVSTTDIADYFTVLYRGGEESLLHRDEIPSELLDAFNQRLQRRTRKSKSRSDADFVVEWSGSDDDDDDEDGDDDDGGDYYE